MITPRQKDKPSTSPQQLSVVCDDIQLSSSRRTPLALKSARKNRRLGGASSGRKTTAAAGGGYYEEHSTTRSRVVSVEEPPDAWSVTRPKRARSRKYVWAAAIWISLLAHCCSPFVCLKSSKIHPSARPILAPGEYFPFLSVPIIVSHFALAVASLTKAFDNNAAVKSSTSLVIIPILSGLTDCAWTWCMVQKNRWAITAAFVLSLVGLVLSLSMYSHVINVRRINLAGVWHLRTRLKTRLLDFWLLEVPVTIKLSYDALTVVVTYSYYRIAKYLETYTAIDQQSEIELTEQLLTAAILTFALVALVTAIGFGAKKRTTPIPPLMSLWCALDWAMELRTVTDLSLSPHLAGVDPMVVNEAFRQTSIAFVVIFGAMALLSVIVNANSSVKRQREARAADGTYSFIGGKSTALYRPSGTLDLSVVGSSRRESSSSTGHYTRRPSEFMIMRSESDESEEDSMDIWSEVGGVVKTTPPPAAAARGGSGH